MSLLAPSIPPQFVGNSQKNAMVTIISPAVSPVYGNNPGYGWLTLNLKKNKYEIDKFVFPFL